MPALCLGSAAVDTSAILKIQELIQAGDLASANAALSSALKSDGRNGGLYNLRGIINVQSGHGDEAESDFAQAIELDPKLLSAYLNLGRLYQSRMDSDPSFLQRAMVVYERALKIQPSSSEVRWQLGTLLEWRGSFATSLSQLAALPDSEQQRSRALALRCADLYALGRKAEAERVARQLIAAGDFSNDDIRLVLPVLEAKGGDKIIEMLIAGLGQRGTISLENQQALAQACERTGHLADARRVLEQVARERARDVGPLLGLARVAYKQKDREGSLGYLAHARDLEPQNAKIYFVFGIIALELRLPLEAQDSMNKALALDPNDPDYNYAMGIVKLHVHDTLEAVPYFEKFLAAKTGNARGHYGLGIAYYFAGNYEKARQEMERAAQASETAAGAHYFLGKIAKASGDDSVAEREFRTTVTQDTKNAEAHAELASLLTRTQRFSEAKDELARALAIDPDNVSANANLLAFYGKTKDARASEQREKLQRLEQKRDELQELLYRRIEVRPY